MRRIKITLLCLMVIAPLISRADDETIVCPGRGERCAYVKILGIKFWQKKERGGPGVIVIKE